MRASTKIWMRPWSNSYSVGDPGRMSANNQPKIMPAAEFRQHARLPGEPAHVSPPAFRILELAHGQPDRPRRPVRSRDRPAIAHLGAIREGPVISKPDGGLDP